MYKAEETLRTQSPKGRKWRETGGFHTQECDPLRGLPLRCTFLSMLGFGGVLLALAWI